MGERDDRERRRYSDQAHWPGPYTEAPTEGAYAGRGPKGYARTDERVYEEACDRLLLHPGIDAREIEVRVANGEVTLEGTVDSRHAKRLAEDVCDGVPGVRDVHNRLRVVPPQG